MSTLELLALEEHRLHEAVKASRGSIEEKAQQLGRDGVLEKYREVHREYVRLARTGNVEAMRRAAHLQWSASLEPTAFTGLGDLEPAACEELVALLAGAPETARPATKLPRAPRRHAPTPWPFPNRTPAFDFTQPSSAASDLPSFAQFRTE